MSEASHSFWKDKLLPSLVGGLIGVLISQTVAFIILYKNLELTVNRERIGTLRKETNILRGVQAEFEQNMEILVTQGQISFDFDAQPKEMGLALIQDPVVREFAKVFLGNQSRYFEVIKVNIPKQYLILGALPFGQTFDEVHPGLVRDLTDFYLRLSKLNTDINTIKTIFMGSGRLIPQAVADTLKEIQGRFEQDVNYITNGRIVDLNKKVALEIRRLEELLAKLNSE